MKELNKPFYYQEIIEGGHGAGADLKQSANTYATEFTLPHPQANGLINV